MPAILTRSDTASRRCHHYRRPTHPLSPGPDDLTSPVLNDSYSYLPSAPVLQTDPGQSVNQSDNRDNRARVPVFPEELPIPNGFLFPSPNFERNLSASVRADYYPKVYINTKLPGIALLSAFRVRFPLHRLYITWTSLACHSGLN